MVNEQHAWCVELKGDWRTDHVRQVTSFSVRTKDSLGKVSSFLKVGHAAGTSEHKKSHQWQALALTLQPKSHVLGARKPCNGRSWRWAAFQKHLL